MIIKMRINKILFQILFVITGIAVLAACQSGATKTAETSTKSASNTPTEAFKSLYGAVKSQNTEDIKANLSKTTIEFAMTVGGMQKKTPEEMFKTGMIQATRAETLPPVRNERVKDNMGALEVRDIDGTWQDVPFILEDGRWKLAVGDIFRGTYQNPAPPQAQTEANNNVPQILPGANITNANPIAKPEKQAESNKSGKK